jgi:hypothetical protein
MSPSPSTSVVDRDVVHPTSYAVRISGGVLISLSILYQPFHQRLFSGDGWEPAWASRPYVEPRINLWIRRDEVDVSTYEVPMTDSDPGSKLIWLSIQYQPFHQLLFAGATMASPTSTVSISAETASGQERTYNLLIV